MIKYKFKIHLKKRIYLNDTKYIKQNFYYDGTYAFQIYTSSQRIIDKMREFKDSDILISFKEYGYIYDYNYIDERLK